MISHDACQPRLVVVPMTTDFATAFAQVATPCCSKISVYRQHLGAVDAEITNPKTLAREKD
jgi:hypothetical protein